MLTRVEAETAILNTLEDIRGIMEELTDEDFTLALYVTKDFLSAYSHDGLRAGINCNRVKKVAQNA